MEARIRLSNETAHQKSTAGYILTWMQNNRERCRNTNMRNIAHAISLSGVPRSTISIEQELNRLIHNQIIVRYNGVRRATFDINYLHKDLPAYVIENASDAEKQRRINATGSLFAIQSIQQEEDSDKEEPEIEKEEATIIEPKPEEPIIVPDEKVSSDAPEENTTSAKQSLAEDKTIPCQNVPVEITSTERGISISITLNLNINK